MKKTRSEIFGHAGKRTEVCFCLTCTFWKSFSGHSASRGVHEGGWQRPLAFVCRTGRRWNFAAVCCVSQQMRNGLLCSCSGAAQKVIFFIEMYCLLLHSWVKMAFSVGVCQRREQFRPILRNNGLFRRFYAIDSLLQRHGNETDAIQV